MADSNEYSPRTCGICNKVILRVSPPTNAGGVASILTLLLMLYLFYRQTHAYLYPSYQARLNTRQPISREKIKVNLDIEFPSFPCEVMGLDWNDVILSGQININSIENWRLDKFGNYIDQNSFQLLRENHRYKQLEMMRQAFEKGYGCRLRGKFMISDIPGNLLISNHAYYAQYRNVMGVSRLSMTHKIHQLYFGNEHDLDKLKQWHPQTQLHLLEGKAGVEKTSGSYKYSIDIVPTWLNEGLRNYYLYQYNYHRTMFNFTDKDTPDQVVFNLKRGGLIVEISSSYGGFFVLLMHLCAVLGGTFVVCRALYILLVHLCRKEMHRKRVEEVEINQRYKEGLQEEEIFVPSNQVPLLSDSQKIVRSREEQLETYEEGRDEFGRRMRKEKKYKKEQDDYFQ